MNTNISVREKPAFGFLALVAVKAINVKIDNLRLISAMLGLLVVFILILYSGFSLMQSESSHLELNGFEKQEVLITNNWFNANYLIPYGG